MILTHGLTDDHRKHNYWEDDTRTHLIQERDPDMYIYYQNYLVKDCGTSEELAQKYGFTLTTKANNSTN